ncbi:MAG: DUF4105 domain-containing protein [Gemmatimonadaceae bacterium]|jgi:hypothetical protein|nr:DUF4105 domain-containing protein [Gemmatimonadaceae bacterium]MBX9854621.1 DUF4105 domain-containing protein [Gemmatimonadaceae bacterium]
MRMRRWLALYVAVACCLGFAGAPLFTPVLAQAPLPDNVAQTPPPPPPGQNATLDSLRAVRGASIEVRLYTYGPGDAVFERFGHIALAVRDTLTGEDLAFNWGMFDFQQPNFLGRFLTGDTRYWMAGYNTEAFNAVYRAENRRIREQRLALTPMQRGALYDYVAWNAQEANKYYRYDYYNDNCSTRVRDALDWVLNGALQTQWHTAPLERTWRGETARITADNLPVFVGIHLALGRRADAPLTAWQSAFLPEHLADALATTRVGNQRLVTADSVIFAANRAPMPATAPQPVLLAAFIGFGLAALLYLWAGSSDVPDVPITSRAAARTEAKSATRSSSRGLSIVGVLWYLTGGVLGTALLLAGTVTKHEPYMGSNLSVLLISPLLLLAAVTWPWREQAGRMGKVARGSSALVAVSAMAGWLGLVVPSLMQGSMVVALVIAPIHVGLALAAWRRQLPPVLRA